MQAGLELDRHRELVGELESLVPAQPLRGDAPLGWCSTSLGVVEARGGGACRISGRPREAPSTSSGDRVSRRLRCSERDLRRGQASTLAPAPLEGTAPTDDRLASSRWRRDGTQARHRAHRRHRTRADRRRIRSGLALAAAAYHAAARKEIEGRGGVVEHARVDARCSVRRSRMRATGRPTPSNASRSALVADRRD